MEKNIQNFVSKKRIAVVGASRSGENFGSRAAVDLEKRGYQIVYVHPEAETINGQMCYPSLEAVKEKADTVWICIPPERGESVLRDAAEADFQHVWLQQGADSSALIDLGKALGLNLVAGKCILMYAEPVKGFHKFHQVIWKWVGQY